MSGEHSFFTSIFKLKCLSLREMTSVAEAIINAVPILPVKEQDKTKTNHVTVPEHLVNATPIVPVINLNPNRRMTTTATNDTDEYDAFISYNWGIKEGVAKLHDKLEEVGLRVWRDKNLIQGSSSLFEQLGKKIKQSRIFLCFLTKDYLASDNCRKEFMFASKLKKTIIYLMIERLSSDDIGEEIGFVMGNSIYTQCYKNPTSWWKENFLEIKEAIIAELSV
jgi:hypothetical protein